MPSLAGLTFLVVLAINESEGRTDARLLWQIQESFGPALELSQNANRLLAGATLSPRRRSCQAGASTWMCQTRGNQTTRSRSSDHQGGRASRRPHPAAPGLQP
jgi:hypothetical protein